MNKTILASVFLLSASVPAMAQDPSWTNFYGGVTAGYAWGDATTRDDVKDWGTDPKFVGPFDNSVGGFLGGGTAGVNLQIQRVVVGLEADFDYADLSGDLATASSQSGHHQNISLDAGFLGDVTARVGFLVDPMTLIYGKGGFAIYTGEANQATTAPGYAPTGTNTFTGAVYGGGIERMIAPDVSVKIEYQHYAFGTQDGFQTNVGDPSSPPGYKFRNHTDLDADSIKAGVVFHLP